MVSIPDWSKFRGLGEGGSSVLSPPSNYHKQRANEAIKQAEEHGYFRAATEDFIQKKYLTQEDVEEAQKRRRNKKPKEADVGDLLLLKLPHARLRGVGDIGLCTNLQICILHNNYITRFDALAPCTQLVRLDLHSNQIALLPGSAFWASMEKLQIVNLHDNPVGGIENLHYLAGCPNLMALTLYNTPLSLKPNYRHHVVNSIWSIRALDRHVVSDEEIIEDADFGGMFSTLHPSFKVNLCPITQEESEEKQSVLDVLRNINTTLAHTSPVLILQRYIRGHLLRKRYKLIRDMRIWAAVTIQRKYREWKGLPTPRTQIPPPPSPVTEVKLPVKAPIAIPAETDKLDYDTYMKNRRPGSVQLSEACSARPLLLPNTPVEFIREDENSKKTNLFINLAKLQTGSIYSAPEDALNTMPSSDRHPDNKHVAHRPPLRKAVPKKKKNEEVVTRRCVKSVKQFFGPVVETVLTPEPDGSMVQMDDEEIPVVSFRLRGRKENVVFYDATTEMLVSRREAGQEIRAAEDNYHGQQVHKPRPIIKPAQNSNDQRMFARVQGTMGLTCLQAIQQAYKDRERAERRAHKLETVSNMKEERSAAKQRIKLYQDDRRNKVLQQRDHEQRRLLDQLEKREQHIASTAQRYHEHRKLSSHFQKHRRDEMTFLMDFNVQNTSVSNALLRHDRLSKREDQNNQNIDVVQTQREMEQEQQSVVKKYMEHRQLMRQTESAMSRAAVDTKMLQEANDRLLRSKTRVAQLKNRNDNISTFYPLPCVSNQPLPNIADGEKSASVSMKNFSKWNSDKLVRYNTVATM